MRFACLSLGLLLALPLAQAQSTNPPNSSSSTVGTGGTATGTTTTPPLQDPQAVNIVNQVLTAAGGAQAINAVTDFTATGNITVYSAGEQTQGTVTVRGLNTTEIRMDTTLPTGVRSWAVHAGIASTKLENGKVVSQNFNRNVPSSDAVAFQTPLFPSSLVFPVRPLGTVVSKQSVGLTAGSGTTQIDGHSVYDIQLKLVNTTSVGGSKRFALTLPSRDLFIDNTSLQIVMVREILPKNVVHEVHYSNYQAVSGVAMPFSISEDIAGQHTWTIQLSQITFNSGLPDSVFALQ